MSHSPLPEEVKLPGLSFIDALKLVLEGARVTRDEWGDKRWYGLLKDNILQIHKAGEAEDVLHPWILNDGDMKADDWELL